ncbi:hypothetical protein ANANG_G00097540 [Anguilla anguilla]|uniref:Polypeptide N-acetylgalactosaminyltransferase n=1 Tax=Anguilla anguilla TaxID=7936 RepID=A0A9D3MGL3_ANGAN|nr:hypothetical protein ANANG_G00097540 [Anguilla anguilla]
MKRRQKRVLQMAFLFMMALIFLPNIGLWSLFKEKHLMKSHETGEQGFQLGLNEGHIYTWTDGLRRRDWHDNESIRRDELRVGKGEQGKPYPLTEDECDDSVYKENGFNIYVSNNIALDRSLPDIRHPNCRQKLYLENLPNTSIIIPFHNEGWSTLLRTVHSITHRTPDHLIAEIILVDDFSDREHLKDKLEGYMARFPKVRIVRTKKREGLIRTRLLGATVAKGDVLTFLDSHCEANVNWLPPLLDQIAQNPRTIVCPMIDVIDHNHFGYEAQAGDAMRGAFDWEMYYKRIPIPPEMQGSDPSDPYESPVMAGGLFAVKRQWFWELGGYDTGLEIWGGEQYEISFKVWMCGGSMYDVPCSRVGHIYRKYVPYKVPSGTSLARNLKRVAETWMDEYTEYIYQRRPEYRHLSPGDLTAQKELRKSLKCHDFKWYMTNVAWDLPKYYPLWSPRLPPGESVWKGVALEGEGRWQHSRVLKHAGAVAGNASDYTRLVSRSSRLRDVTRRRVGTGWRRTKAGPGSAIQDAAPPTSQLPITLSPRLTYGPIKRLRRSGNPGVCRWIWRCVRVGIRNVASGLCVDSKHGATGTELRLDTCLKEGAERTWAHEQIFTFGWREDIRPGDPLHTRKLCLDAISSSSPVTLYDCHGMKGNQHWQYRKDKSLQHLVSSSCMDSSAVDKRIFMNKCNPQSETQKWLFQHINVTVLDKFNSPASS